MNKSGGNLMRTGDGEIGGAKCGGCFKPKFMLEALKDADD